MIQKKQIFFLFFILLNLIGCGAVDSTMKGLSRGAKWTLNPEAKVQGDSQGIIVKDGFGVGVGYIKNTTPFIKNVSLSCRGRSFHRETYACTNFKGRSDTCFKDVVDGPLKRYHIVDVTLGPKETHDYSLPGVKIYEYEVQTTDAPVPVKIVK